MRPENFTNHSKQLGYLVALGGAAVAVAAFIVLSTWSAMPVEVMSSQESAAGAILSVAPHAGGSDPSVPAASSVFSAPSYQAEEHVQAF